MLAKLLQRFLAMQCLIGAALGYAAWVQAPGWGLWVGAALTPLLVMALLTLVSCIQSRAANEPAWMWWRSLLGEFVASVRIFFLRQPWARAQPSVLPATGSPAALPVILVHGYLCNHRIWDDMVRTLRAQGHAVIAVDLEPLFTSIDHYAPRIDAAVNALCLHSAVPQVALVGHSMGGLAIRAWMRSAGSQRVAQVVTLGTPHAGTQVAPNGHTPNGRQMVWHSAWLQKLAKSETAATRALFQIAITAQDNIVFPQREQTLSGVVPTVFEGIGHLQMCLDARVIGWVRDCLRRGPVA